MVEAEEHKGPVPPLGSWASLPQTAPHRSQAWQHSVLSTAYQMRLFF